MTASTGMIRKFYASAYAWRFQDSEGETDLAGLREEQFETFDRWLEEHDREVSKKAWSEGANHMNDEHDCPIGPNPYEEKP